MNTREKMREWREKRGIKICDISKLTGISGYLIGLVEDGEVTHPDIAKALGRAYGLSDEETYELMPEFRRPTSPFYDPNRYVQPEEITGGRFTILKRDQDEFKDYICDKQAHARRNHQKRGEYGGI